MAARYFRILTSDPGYRDALAACRAKHEAAGVGRLSVILNKLGTEALVKVAESGKWQPPGVTLSAAYTKSTDVAELLKTATWFKEPL